ncbi:FecR domain-containing protein [Chitinophaga sp. 212800010-3]|uniref:FecR family protein n=1 Tax=unclassified Chitinophaga TaxID=2619133 RepID=UPI002DF53362|nr:hypothetical protein [Chitinophaga sp. 212800010-3]
MKKMPTKIEEIIIKELQDGLQMAEHRLLERWRQQSWENDHEFLQILKIWNLCNTLLLTNSKPINRYFDTARAWEKINMLILDTVKPELDLARNFTSRPAGRRVPIPKAVLAMAACVAAILLAGWWPSLEPSPDLQTVTAEKASRYLILPDGTNVRLRKGATIRFPKTFLRNKRRVLLSGEAFFDVKSSVYHPFRIQMARSTIEVLGTSFLASANAQSDRVVLIAGKILLVPKQDPQKQCILLPSQELLLTDNNLEVKTISDSTRCFGEPDTLSFSKTPLKQVVQEISWHFGTPIVLAGSLLPKSEEITVTATFGKQTLTQVLGELTLLTGLHCRRQQGTVILY